MDIKDEKIDYQITIEDIRFTKKQIWNTIYYALIANGGIITLIFSLNSNQIVLTVTWHWIFTAICIFISFFGILLLSRYHWSLTEYRLRKEKLRKGESDYDNIQCKEIRKRFFCQIDFWFFTFPFSLIILIASILALFVIWNIDC